jgi:acyl-CoA thioester hydrolase
MENEIEIRVRFNDTDCMQYVYHGNYAAYYHQCRTELLRKVGLSDKSFEKQNVILPVIEMHTYFNKPAFYDDILKVKTVVKEVSNCKLSFDYEIYNQDNELINIANTVHAYVDNKTRKPLIIPENIKNKF